MCACALLNLRSKPPHGHRQSAGDCGRTATCTHATFSHQWCVSSLGWLCVLRRPHTLPIHSLIGVGGGGGWCQLPGECTHWHGDSMTHSGLERRNGCVCVCVCVCVRVVTTETSFRHGYHWAFGAAAHLGKLEGPKCRRCVRTQLCMYRQCAVSMR